MPAPAPAPAPTSPARTPGGPGQLLATSQSPLSSDSTRPLAPLDCGWRYSWSRLRRTRSQQEALAQYDGVRAWLAPWPRPRVGWTGGGVAVAARV